jgi:hypothetical protein
MESDRLILVEENGDLRAFVGRSREGLREFVGRYRPLAASPQLLILRRQAGNPPEGHTGRILMAGEILYQNTVLEVVNLIAASRWTGSLHVYATDVHRILGLEKGFLRFANSDDPGDRLNRVLFRLGALSPAQSEEVERGPRADKRFGEGLIRTGMMDEKQLFGYLKRQMEEIFFSAVLGRDGCYVFTAEDDEPSQASVTGYIALQQLLFDGAERLDRYREFEKLIADEDLCPVVRPGVEVTSVDPRTRRVLAICDGSRSVREIARETWLGRFDTMAVVYELLRHDQVLLEHPRRSVREVAQLLVTPFDEALRAIAASVERTGNPERTRRELERWVETSPYREQLQGVLTPTLTLDVERVATNLGALSVRDARDLVEQALHELVSFALFAASLSLPRDEERNLSKRVQERLG